MGDTGDDYRGWDQLKKEKKRKNKAWTMEYLKKNSIPYESKNHGEHLIISTDMGKIDFWPSTGKWSRRHDGKRSGNPLELFRLI